MHNERKRTDAGAAKGKRKISFLRALMVSLAVIVLIQGALPISVLAFSGVKGTLEDNAISIDARAVDNRRVNLESAMVKSMVANASSLWYILNPPYIPCPDLL